VVRDIPAILRGTVGSQASLTDGEPLLVSSYAVVAGLDGTGSSDVPIPVRTQLEREAALRGFGSVSYRLQDISPTELLNSMDTAVVEVRGVVPAGAAAGDRFDVTVQALTGTSTTSLEGGRLYTIGLRPGFPTAGVSQRPAVAEAGGPVFLNPFAEPGQLDAGAITMLRGRILGGGVVTTARPLLLILDNPSHARVRAMVDAINQKFPRERGRGEIARGLDDERIELFLPESFRGRADEFIQLVLHLRVDQRFPGEMAKRYADALTAQPELAGELSWCLEAIGRSSLQVIADLYDYPEAQPRLAALRAGARLGDPRTAPHLIELARSGPSFLRDDAISLLGRLPIPNPPVNEALRALVDDGDVNVRVAAYEALVERSDWSVQRSRAGTKFWLDRVESRYPMIYIGLQDEPRIVVFGDAVLDVGRFSAIWSNMLLVDTRQGNDTARVLYTPNRGDSVQFECDRTIEDFLQVLAHKQTIESPDVGLDLTYAQTISALYHLEQEGGLAAEIMAEQDRLSSMVLAASDSYIPPSRPESDRVASSGDPPPSEETATADPEEQDPTESGTGLVVPLPPPTPKER
jgi:hypothetical protein